MDGAAQRSCEELGEALGDTEAVEHELGDVLFSLVNLARHLHIDPEMSLRQAVDRFSDRFRCMEATGDLNGLTLDELNALWEQAKARRPTGRPAAADRPRCPIPASRRPGDLNGQRVTVDGRRLGN